MKNSKKDRKNDHALYHHLYERHYLEEGYVCMYCGEPADTLDHIPPLSVMRLLDAERRRKDGIVCSLVPCCRECNLVLGGRHLLTVADRLEFLEKHYEKKFDKQESFWSDDEINELGFSLRNFVKAKQQKLNRYIDMIRNIQLRMINTDTHPR